MRSTAKVLLLGLFNTSHVVEEEARQSIDAITEIVIEDTLKFEGDIIVATKGLMDGIIEYAHKEKLNMETAINELATSAFGKARDINPEMGNKLKEMLSSNEIEGVKVEIYEEKERVPVEKEEIQERDEKK